MKSRFFMKNRFRNLVFGLMLCICMTLLPGMSVSAADARDAYYNDWYFRLWDADGTSWTDGVTIHEGETLKLCIMREDSYGEGTYELESFSGSSSRYYDWAITTGSYFLDEDGYINLDVDWESIAYDTENASTWVTTAVTTEYVYLKGLKATDDADNLYLTLYCNADYYDEPRAYAFVPITVVPAEEGVTYKDYGSKEITDLYKTKDELYAAMRKVFAERKTELSSFYTTVDLAESISDGYLPDIYYSDFDFDLLNIFDSYSDQSSIAPTEGDYLQQCHYGSLSSAAVLDGNYRGTQLVRFEIDTTGAAYQTTLEQEQEFERKLASLFVGSGELAHIKSLSDYDKIVAIKDYISSHVSYVSSYNALDHSAYSALCRGQATCQGYSLLYYRMLRMVGIPNRILMGVDAGAHTYNIILMDGKYYYSDALTDDVLTGADNFSPAELQERFLTSKFKEGVLSKLSATDYDPSGASTPTVPAIDYSAVFDAGYYYDNNSDLAAGIGYNEAALLSHFVNYGMAEGRQGSADFNLNAYKELNGDLVAAFGDDNKSYYMHYINYGKAEGRPAVYTTTDVDTSAYALVYDTDYYYNNNADLAAGFGYNEAKLFQHFLDAGMAEGRPSSPDFDLNAYKELNSDLYAGYGDDNKQYYNHYLNYGHAEGRPAVYSAVEDTTVDTSAYTLVYNTDYYYNNNPDLAAGFGYNEQKLFYHFIDFGMAEGRPSCADFDLNAYKELNPDLYAGYGDDNKQYYNHYLNYGHAEGRPALYSAVEDTTVDTSAYALVYDTDYYYNNNPDLAAGFGYNEAKLFDHFVNYGMAEGRPSSANFNLNVYKTSNPDLYAGYGDNNKMYYEHYINYGYDEGRVAN